MKISDIKYTSILFRSARIIKSFSKCYTKCAPKSDHVLDMKIYLFLEFYGA